MLRFWSLLLEKYVTSVNQSRSSTFFNTLSLKKEGKHFYFSDLLLSFKEFFLLENFLKMEWKAHEKWKKKNVGKLFEKQILSQKAKIFSFCTFICHFPSNILNFLPKFHQVCCCCQKTFTWYFQWNIIKYEIYCSRWRINLCRKRGYWCAL